MIVYGISCAAACLVAYIGNRNRRKRVHRAELVFFSSLPLILVAALRYDVGKDYLSGYVSYFEMIQLNTLSQKDQMDFLFHVLNWVIAKLGGSYVWVFAICAVVFYLFTVDQVFEDSPNPALSIFLLTGMGYLFIFLNAMRQMVGCAILLWSVRFIREKRFIPFLLCVAAAAGFHMTCVFFLVAYFVARVRITPIRAAVLTVVILCLSQIITEIVKAIMRKTQYAVYLYSVFDTGKDATVTILMLAVLAVFFSVFYADNPKFQMYYNFLLSALWISFFSGRIVLGIRMMWMFGLTTIISLPLVVESILEEKSQKVLKAAIVLLYSVYTLITVGVQNSNSVLPYQTILSRWF